MPSRSPLRCIDSAAVREVEPEGVDAGPFYKVTLDNGFEVETGGTTGEVLETGQRGEDEDEVDEIA